MLNSNFIRNFVLERALGQANHFAEALFKNSNKAQERLEVFVKHNRKLEVSYKRTCLPPLHWLDRDSHKVLPVEVILNR